MILDADACYRALVARDARFDGLFFVAVSTTGIYCRPVCKARTAGRDRCTFYSTAVEAERDGYRACLRCRPELAPGAAPVDSISRLVATVVQRIEHGVLNEATLEDLAGSLGVTARHLRRSMQTELGISPMELVQSRRLALAKQLLHETWLSMTDIAFASGFQSVRRFNTAFRTIFGRPPSTLRRSRQGARRKETITLTLAYRPPYDWPAILQFLARRAVPGVEVVRDGIYMRTVQLGRHRGSIAVNPIKARHALRAEVSLSLAGVLAPLVPRLRRLFDVDARPDAIAEHLSRDPLLARSLEARPGLRVPGAFDGLEYAIRAVLGQQVSVAAATTLAGRLAVRFGEPLDTGHQGLTRLWPESTTMGSATEAELTHLGILSSRARTLRAIVAFAARRPGVFESCLEAEGAINQLVDLPGVGDWTAQYIAMRALSWPDAFPAGDLGVRKALGGISEPAARRRAERWRPWRAYAVMHLWQSDFASRSERGATNS